MYDNHRKEQQNPVKKHRYNNHSAGQQKKNAGFAWLSALLPRLYPPVPVAAVCFSCRSVPSAVGCGYTPVPVARCRCPPACLDCTRQFQLQLPVRRSSAGFGCRSVPSAVGCGYTPAPVTLQLQLLIRFSCPYWICTSTAAACPQVVCGIRSPS